MKDRKCILIVDDEEDILLFLEDRLTALGYDILTASNGKEGLDTMQGQDVDGVLLDLNMPVMGGITMLKNLSHSPRALPVIVMSAEENRPQLEQAIIMGAMDFLIKPLSYEDLTTKCLRLFQ